MKRAILALSLLAAPALGQTSLPKTCKVETFLTVMAGNSLSGPLDVGVTNGVAALHLDAGATLHGPLTIMICDGKVEISGTPP